jgi:hypothetical protein
LVTAPIVFIRASDNCATGFVEIFENWYTEEGREENFGRADRLNSTTREINFFHNYFSYNGSFEARKGNTPVEYIQYSGEPNDRSALKLKTSVIAEVQASDTCFTLPSSGWAINASACGTMDQVLATVAGAGTYRYYRITNSSNPLGSETTDESPSTFYVTALAMKDGFPKQRMTIRLTEEQTFEYRFYSYSEPTTVFPYAKNVTGTSTTTSSIADVSTTVLPTSTTIENTTTIPSSDTSEAPSTTTAGNTDVDAIRQQFEADCGQLDGVEVFPAPEDWTDSTQFEISISNACMARIFADPLDRRIVRHRIDAVNRETGETIRMFKFAGDPRLRVSLNGRLPVGDWELTIRQFANVLLPDREVQFSARTLNVNVRQDPESRWKWCSKEDISFNATQLVVDCDYTAADFSMNVPNSPPRVIPLNSRGIATDSALDFSGWTTGTVVTNSDGYRTLHNLVLCTTDCETLPSEIDAEVQRTEQGILLTPQISPCQNPREQNFGMRYLIEVNNNFFLDDPTISGETLDQILEGGVTSLVTVPTSATHVMLFRRFDSDRDECRGGTLMAHQWSVIALPTTEVASDENVQPVAGSFPALIDNLELSRQDTLGQPVIVESNQTFIEIPASAVLPFLNNGSVTSVSVQTTDGLWRPISTSLSTFAPIDSSVTNVLVKYIFADGIESIITMPVISADAYEDALNTGASSSSSPLMIIVIVLALLAIAAGGITVVRRRV